MSIRATIGVHGAVQGVAFRSAVKGMADEMGIRGTIENLDDGSVLLLCEAQKQDIELLIEKIKSVNAPIHITGMRIEYSAATGEYKTFDIILGDTQKELLSVMITGTTYLEKISRGIESIKAQNETLIEYAEDNSKKNNILIEYAKDHSKQNETIMGQNETIMGQNETLIEYAKDNSKQNETLIEYAKDNSKQNETC